MGLHTWFYKDKTKYLRKKELDIQLEDYYQGNTWIEELDRLPVQEEYDNLYDKNSTDYHDLFRTSKREPDGSYPLDVIYSRKQCFEWIENPDNYVYYSHTMFDTEEQIADYKVKALQMLHQFWDEYPDGVIDFG